MEVSRIVIPFPTGPRASSVFQNVQKGPSSLLDEDFHAGRNLSFEVMLLYSQADHPPPPRVEVKDEWR